MRSQKDLVHEMIQCLEKLDRNDPAAADLTPYLYTADIKLPTYLRNLASFLASKRTTHSERLEGGKLLEQISYLVFSGLHGITSIKSFQSAGPQYDLLVCGDTADWYMIAKLLYLDESERDIIIEAKATNAPIPDKQFARLCYIMDTHLPRVGLGVLFTLKGATGFPKKGDEIRQRKIGDSRLCQALFHAKTGKKVVVLDETDIFSLGENGSLLKLLIRKIRDLSELSGLPTISPEIPLERDLPHHLRQLITDPD